MPFDAYETYCEHCRAIGQPPPSREWWDACAKTFATSNRKWVHFDIETERREGWTYDRR